MIYYILGLAVIIFCLFCYIIYLHMHNTIINKCNIVGLQYYKANPDISNILDDTQKIILDLQKIGCYYARDALKKNKEIILSQTQCSIIASDVNNNINSMNLGPDLTNNLKKLYADILNNTCVGDKVDKTKLYALVSGITNSLCYF